MSITSDIRSYADTAVSQGKQVLDQAQAQLNDVSGSAGDVIGKARANVNDIADKAAEATTELRASVEKAINLEAVKAAIEPYLAQVNEYRITVTDRAEGLISGIKSDKRVSKLVDTAGSMSEVVVGTVTQRVVKPVRSLTGLGGKPAAKTSPNSPTFPAKATKPAATRSTRSTATPSPKATTAPATTAPATTAPATKATARKAPAKRTTKA